MKKISLVISSLLFLSPAIHAMETSESSAVQACAVDYSSDPRYKTVQKIIEYVMYSGTSEDIRNFRLVCKTIAQESAKLLSDKDKKEISKFFNNIKRECTGLASSKFITTKEAPTGQELKDAIEEEIKEWILAVFSCNKQNIFEGFTNNIKDKIKVGKLVGYFNGQEYDLLFALLLSAALKDKSDVLHNLLHYVVGSLSLNDKKELLGYVAQAKGKKLAGARMLNLPDSLVFELDKMRYKAISLLYGHIEDLIYKLPVRECKESANNNLL